MRSDFYLFQSHLDLAHRYWSEGLDVGDEVLDATCGNGHDSLVLAELILSAETGYLHLCDIQESAIAATRQRLAAYTDRCRFHHGDHAGLGLAPDSLNAVVYNLGYLPGSDKTLTTTTETTLQSINRALDWVKAGGFISITCYPGHEAGASEEEALLHWSSQLNPAKWSVCHHRWINRRRAPSLLFLQKAQPKA